MSFLNGISVISKENKKHAYQWRSAQRTQHRIILYDFAEPKIGNLQQCMLVGRCEQYIIRLQIAMRDFAIVQILDGMAHLVKVKFTILFRQKFLLLDACEKFTAAHQLQRDVDGIGGIQNVVHFNNAWMR